MSVRGRYLPPVAKFWASGVCRIRKLCKRNSVSILEKTGAQNWFSRNGKVLEAPTDGRCPTQLLESAMNGRRRGNRCSNRSSSYLNLGNLVTVFILLALLRIFASLASRVDISLFRKSNLCEEGFSNSNCLVIAVEFLIDLISLISSIARLRLIRRLAVDVGSIWGEVSMSSPDS